MEKQTKFYLLVYIIVVVVLGTIYSVYYHSTHTEICLVEQNEKTFFMKGSELKEIYENAKIIGNLYHKDILFIKSITNLDCDYYKNKDLLDLDVINYDLIQEDKSFFNYSYQPFFPS